MVPVATFQRKTIGVTAVPRALAAAACALAMAACSSDPDRKMLSVVSWGGAYGRAQEMAWFEPFAESTGTEVSIDFFNGGLAQVRTQVNAGNVYWDIVDLDLADAARACDEGLLEIIDVDILAPAPDGTPGIDDYDAGELPECGVGVSYYAGVVAYNRDYYPGDKPETIADFFDLEKFPGRRGMQRNPQPNLERALMGDGVPLDSVYAVLDTPEGLDRAFRKLDTIKDQIVWWEAGAQPPQLLADGEVAMTTSWNGRIFNAQVEENQPFEIMWDGAILSMGQLTIVAGSKNLETALEFLTFATVPENLAGISRYISYGPMRISARQFVGRHVGTGVEMAPHLPTYPDNSKGALRDDWQWWGQHRDEMNELFSAWLAR